MFMVYLLSNSTQTLIKKKHNKINMFGHNSKHMPNVHQSLHTSVCFMHKMESILTNMSYHIFQCSFIAPMSKPC